MSLSVWLYMEFDTGGPEPFECTLYSANVTHNLGRMAEAAGIYKAIWHPDENGFKTASDLIQPLQLGLDLLKHFPERFRSLNPPNGWGSYDDFVTWVSSYLEACTQHPKAAIRKHG